jgi:CheY-like chemotaxis protein
MFRVAAMCSAKSRATITAMVPLTVIVVDDSEAFRNVACTLLEKQGLKVLGRAASGAQALRLASELNPQVILVDVMLGEESGLELTRRLYEQAGADAPPIILISTHSEHDVAELVADSPAVGFLTKSELGADSIRRILAQRPS